MATLYKIISELENRKFQKIFLRSLIATVNFQRLIFMLTMTYFSYISCLTMNQSPSYYCSKPFCYKWN